MHHPDSVKAEMATNISYLGVYQKSGVLGGVPKRKVSIFWVYIGVLLFSETFIYDIVYSPGTLHFGLGF